MYEAVVRLRNRFREEGGMTLVELFVATAVMGLAASVFLSILASSQRGVSAAQLRSANNDQARLAMEQLNREILSGNILYDPALEDDIPNYSMRIYTQANATTRDPAFQCVQWKIDNGKRLRRRSWPPGQPAKVGQWRTIAEGVVNRKMNIKAFVLDPDPTKGGRTVKITMLVNTDKNFDKNSKQTVRLESAVTGRNTSFGYPVTSCAVTPTDPEPG